MTYFW